jgi:3'(2'), 5'-bisphosphate nucleotidase
MEPPVSPPELTALLDGITRIATRAAMEILRVADQATARLKSDGSPVTCADEEADALIRAELHALAPDVPVISEEGGRDATAGEHGNGRYFLVDPLDGTREFIDGRNDYAVNIALIEQGRPRLGLVAAPALGVIWRGIVGQGAERISLHEPDLSEEIHARARASEPVVMVSRSHLDVSTRAYVEGVAQAKLVACGSSIKFCRLAEGAADLYPRFGPTHDWDIAAGHAVLEAAGGRIVAPDGSALRYGTPAQLIPAFIASGA